MFQTSAMGRVAGAPGGWPGGRVTIPIIIPLCGPSCKLRFARIYANLKFQDGLSVAITSVPHIYD